ncbi:MAG: ECF transporter S component [Clostridia bacterium]|nr:ECF transporter S component [Clostridia bacterium]
MNKREFSVFNITFIAMMAAMVYVVTLFRFPLLGSKVHFANAVCLLSGILLGPLQGSLAAGIGSAFYDAVTGYDLINVLITFVSKFAMAWVCGTVLESRIHIKGRGRIDRTALACVCGALTYVALYMLKTFIYQKFVYGYPMDAVWATMVAKLIPSLINAGVAIVAAPLFYHAVLPALRASGLLNRMNPQV